jgi:hypothetical protein
MTDGRPIVTQLFEAIGIKRVVYIDDRFGLTRDRLIELCRSLTAVQITECRVFPDLDLSDDEAIREQRLGNAIARLPQNALAGAFDAIQAAAGLGEASQDKLAVEAFSEVVGVAAQVKMLGLAEWQSQLKTIISEMASTPTLFVFDDDFRLESGKADDGRRLIAGLHAELQEYKYAYALLTHNATTDETESQIEREIATSYPEIEDFVVVIAKSRLTGDDRNRFVHRLKATLMFRLFRVLRAKLKAAASAAHDKAVAKIESFGVDAFERVIHYSSREEGAWSPETLVRVFGVVHDREIRSRLRSDEILHDSISGIDPLCSIETGGISEVVEKIAESLQRAEVYDSDADLNSLHLPVDCGDVFQSEAGDQYLLVAQACDLAVRQDGRRRKDAREERQVVTLLKVGSKAKSKKESRLRDNEFELCHFADCLQNIWFGEVNQSFHVPIWILDLAVLNSEGACRISSAEVAQRLLTLPWRNRLEILRQRARDVVALVEAATTPAGANHEELLRALLRLPLSTMFSVRMRPVGRQQSEAWQLEIGLRRVLRLRERYASALLSYYANYLARPAHPHDLTNIGAR